MITQAGPTSHATGRWAAEPPALRAAWVSEIGPVRAENQDRVFAGPRVVVLADGVGSQPGSGQVADFVVHRFVESAGQARCVDDVFVAVNSVQGLTAEAIAAGELPAGATTLTAAVHLGTEIALVNVGDSPAWVAEPGGWRVLTMAHRRWDPFLQAYVLLSAIGDSRSATVSLSRIPLLGRLRLVLASDGVLDPARPGDTPAALQTAVEGSAQDAAAAVVRAALSAGAHDNVTAAVVDVGVGENWNAVEDGGSATIAVAGGPG